MKLGLIPRWGLIAAAAILIPAAASAQNATPVADSIGSTFRNTIDSVATAADMSSLRNRELPDGVRREIRIYIGFGLGFPQRVARLWEDARGAQGWLGLWWPGTRLTYRIANGTEADYAAARQERTSWVAAVRDFAAELGCTDFRARPSYELCTLPAQHVAWSDVLARLDRLGIGQLPHLRDRIGFDGVTLVVEYRDRDGYRAYSYWAPRLNSTDSHERSAAAIMEAITRLPDQADSDHVD